VLIEYHLTEKGADLNKILYELSMFGAKHYTEEVFGVDQITDEEAIDIFGYGFKLDKHEIDFHKSPVINSNKRIDLIAD